MVSTSSGAWQLGQLKERKADDLLIGSDVRRQIEVDKVSDGHSIGGWGRCQQKGACNDVLQAPG